MRPRVAAGGLGILLAALLAGGCAPLVRTGSSGPSPAELRAWHAQQARLADAVDDCRVGRAAGYTWDERTGTSLEVDPLDGPTDAQITCLTDALALPADAEAALRGHPGQTEGSASSGMLQVQWYAAGRPRVDIAMMLFL